MTAFRYVAFLLLVLAFGSSVSAFAEEAQRMSKAQYDAYLDELDSKIPLLRAHFSTLCTTPVWRRQDSEVQVVADQVLNSCRKLSGEMLPYLSESIKGEHTSPKLSVEFRMQYALQELVNIAASASSVRPYYDSGNDDATYLLKNLAPLATLLYGHVYASIDDSKCTVF
jgi:hypothetical protein